eukprot:417673-Amphidinium_carterae.1
MALCKGTWMVHVPEHSTSPVAALEVLMKGKKTDWEAAKRAAARIRDEDQHFSYQFRSRDTSVLEVETMLAARIIQVIRGTSTAQY